MERDSKKQKTGDERVSLCSSRDLSEMGKKSIKKQFGCSLLQLTVKYEWEPEEQVQRQHFSFRYILMNMSHHYVGQVVTAFVIRSSVDR